MCWRLTGWALDWALESAHCSVVPHKPLNSCRTLSCLIMVLLWIRFFKVIHLQREYISHFWKHSLLSSNIYLHTNLLHTKVKCHVFSLSLPLQYAVFMWGPLLHYEPIIFWWDFLSRAFFMLVLCHLLVCKGPQTCSTIHVWCVF